jgi:hypothetical protein
MMSTKGEAMEKKLLKPFHFLEPTTHIPKHWTLIDAKHK